MCYVDLEKCNKDSRGKKYTNARDNQTDFWKHVFFYPRHRIKTSILVCAITYECERIHIYLVSLESCLRSFYCLRYSLSSWFLYMEYPVNFRSTSTRTWFSCMCLFHVYFSQYCLWRLRFVALFASLSQKAVFTSVLRWKTSSMFRTKHLHFLDWANWNTSFFKPHSICVCI